MTRYRTIVADPPWSYDEGWPAVTTSAATAKTTGFATTANGHDSRLRRPLPYSAMTLEAIGALPVGELAETNAHLFVWTTNRYLRNAYEITEGWGFRPSQLLTWCKGRRGLGPGGLFASTSEFILYARHGKPEHKQRIDSSWWEWPRGAHSAKPDAFLDLVEIACPGPYVELFARRARFGWDYWGDESLGTAELAA